MQDERANNDTRKKRRSTVPAVYLPPVGVKLMKKYSTDLDVKSSLRLISSMSSILSTTEGELTPTAISPLAPIPGLKTNKTKVIKDTDKQNIERSYISKLATDDPEEIINKQMKPRAKEQPVNQLISDDEYEPKDSNQLKHEMHKADFSNDQFRYLDNDNIGKTVKSHNASFKEKKNSEVTSNVTITIDKAEEEGFANDEVFTDLDESKLYIPYRRSSITTFRSRTTLRLHSLPSILEEHNLHVISMPKPSKSLSRLNSGSDVDEKHLSRSNTSMSGNHLKVGGNDSNFKFCLDYGDGVLHDTLKIPKVKDCFRPWCNPFCKTCQMRSHRRPCFVLVPYQGKEPPKRRRPSMFQMLNGAASDSKSNMELTNSIEKKDDNPETTKAVSKIGKGKTDKTRADKNIQDSNDLTMPSEEDVYDVLEGQESTTENNDDSDSNLADMIEIEKLLQLRFQYKKKGYSRKRMEQLSKPRGGDPAEVRFSKAALNRKHKELVEVERNRGLTVHEQQNLSFIQGKISVFLAMLNEKELSKKPMKMPDIPIREVIDSDKLVHEAKKRNKKKGKQTYGRSNWRFKLGAKLQNRK